ncbi:hypothetical protein Tco_1435731 [Tanacetum coccineum]
MKLEKALIDFDSHQERRLSSLGTQLGQHQDDMISKINLLWKTFSEKLDDMPIRNTAGNPTALMNFASTDYPTKEELRGKGIKSPSKLLAPKYLSQSSLAEQNRKPSSPKCVHFVNSIIILNKEDESKEEGSVKSSVTKNEDHEMTFENVEEFKEETKEETEEEEEDNPKHFDTFPTMKELGYHEWLLKNPRPHGVIDHELGSVVFGKPFVEATGLVYDMKEGTIMFEKDKEKIVFKMPHKMEMFNLIDFTDIKTDRIPPFVIKGDDDKSEKTYYSDSLDLGLEYKYDENVCRSIRSLISMKARRNKGEVT